MTEKFEFYDVLGILVPGAMLLALIGVSFPGVTTAFAGVGFPAAFAVICLTAVAAFLGQLVQTISSFLELVFNWTWGGRPSERALKEGLGTRYFPADSANRIRAKLARSVGETASDRSLFLYAMQKAETSGNSRVAKFNGLYAYHRAMLALVLISLGVILASMCWGMMKGWTWRDKIGIVAVYILLLVVFWVRAKQRGFYYVREVLSTTERLLDAGGAAVK
jgi:hypothetical protein